MIICNKKDEEKGIEIAGNVIKRADKVMCLDILINYPLRIMQLRAPKTGVYGFRKVRHSFEIDTC